MKKLVMFVCSLSIFALSHAQPFTYADTLRGSITPERAWWDVLRYDIEVKPDYQNKTIEGVTTIIFQTHCSGSKIMQVDLQAPLIIDSIQFYNKNVSFRNIDSNVYHVYLKNAEKKNYFIDNYRRQGFMANAITIYYHGKPTEAIKPPWDGGFVWAKDSLGRSWVSVACQGLGASVWYPCKDHQSDEPDMGASLTIIIPDTLMAVGNGRLASSKKNNDGTATYKWEVKNPINNYDIIPYIGKYVNFSDTLHGEKGILDLNYWVLDYNLEKAKNEFQQVKPMLHCFEYWFGPYPFYEDGYKLVDAPYLGMEHQSAVAYGNGYENGYHGTDLSGTGWGMKWDFIIVHESGHEWFGNNITTKDIADMWVHEGFTNYSETLYTEWLFGKQAGNEYNYGIRKNIENKNPVISMYGVNRESEGTDKYYKAANMIHIIRHVIDNDEKFRNILRGLNKTFYHATVTTKQIEDYISKESGINFSKVFDQYLRDTLIPQLQYYYTPDKKKICYHWANCSKDFNMPLVLHSDIDSKSSRLSISEKWKSTEQITLFDTAWIEKNYYITIKEAAPNK
ncbi:MAG: M1 family metallopeptidase [Parafilimonas sp.]